jgi:hypothetical protein
MPFRFACLVFGLGLPQPEKAAVAIRILAPAEGVLPPVVGANAHVLVVAPVRVHVGGVGHCPSPMMRLYSSCDLAQLHGAFGLTGP